MERLSGKELTALIRSVFSITKNDNSIAILIDLPDNRIPDNDAWKSRRRIVWEWTESLNREKKSLSMESVTCFAYPNVHSNNADLPDTAYAITQSPESLDAECLPDHGESFTYGILAFILST